MENHHPAADAVTTEVADLRRIDAVIGRFFAAFDNRAGRVPELECLSALFAGKAVVAIHSASGPVICSVEEFARPRIELLSSGRLVDFFEWETTAETQIVGPMAARKSRYSKSGALDGSPYSGSGTKLFQLALAGAEWRIVALSWFDDENERTG
jgi:hypothetical protein